MGFLLFPQMDSWYPRTEGGGDWWFCSRLTRRAIWIILHSYLPGQLLNLSSSKQHNMHYRHGNLWARCFPCWVLLFIYQKINGCIPAALLIQLIYMASERQRARPKLRNAMKGKRYGIRKRYGIHFGWKSEVSLSIYLHLNREDTSHGLSRVHLAGVFKTAVDAFNRIDLLRFEHP